MSSLNHRTLTKKVCNKFKKVNRNYKPRKISLERGGNTIALSDEIADTFTNHYANISKDPYKKRKSGKHRKRKKDRKLKTVKNKRIQHLEKILYIPR